MLAHGLLKELSNAQDVLQALTIPSLVNLVAFFVLLAFIVLKIRLHFLVRFALRVIIACKAPKLRSRVHAQRAHLTT